MCIQPSHTELVPTLSILRDNTSDDKGIFKIRVMNLVKLLLDSVAINEPEPLGII